MIGDAAGLVVAAAHEAEMFCRNNSACALVAESMKCRSLSAGITNRTPLLGNDANRGGREWGKPVQRVAVLGLNSANSLPSTTGVITS